MKRLLTIKNLFNNAKGFTLVEIAIVLVIIGIILGAAMKGKDLIYGARYKKFINAGG
ncbi:MAG: prepilin-type N-terminal cleavage/methylation domain-containing protein, partial [Nitrospirae bacterium]|nr:prepilin-type N-terminal cleavage/methylation domain-containing protein [Nitrospirota bacterium]